MIIRNSEVKIYNNISFKNYRNTLLNYVFHMLSNLMLTYFIKKKIEFIN